MTQKNKIGVLRNSLARMVHKYDENKSLFLAKSLDPEVLNYINDKNLYV